MIPLSSPKRHPNDHKDRPDDRKQRSRIREFWQFHEGPTLLTEMEMDHFQPNHDISIFGLNPWLNFRLTEFHQMNRFDSWLTKVRQMNRLNFQQMEWKSVMQSYISDKRKCNRCSCWIQSNIISNHCSHVSQHTRQLTMPKDCQPLH